MNIRVGQGFDVHAFESGDHVTLCGVKIPHNRGLKAHSDGDVALHALCDALLGAAALGDIGQHFPPTEQEWRDADSRALLRKVVKLLRAAQWGVVNVDVTRVCERPRIGPHRVAMLANLATDLGVSKDRISIKATTTEGLGYCGREEGIAAMAIALIERQ